MPEIKDFIPSLSKCAQAHASFSVVLDKKENALQRLYQLRNLKILNIASVWLNCGDNFQTTKIIKPAKIY